MNRDGGDSGLREIRHRGPPNSMRDGISVESAVRKSFRGRMVAATPRDARGRLCQRSDPEAIGCPLNRTNHTSYHLGQVILAPNSSPKQDEKDWFLHGRDPAYQYASKRMDVHKEAITIAVLNGSGKLVMESIIETKAITILEDQKLGRIGPSLDHQS